MKYRMFDGFVAAVEMSGQRGGDEKVMSYCEAVSHFKREFLIQMLSVHGGNRTRTARALGLPRTYLHRLLRVLKIGRAAGRPSERLAP